MKIELEMTCGFICCAIALILFGLTMWFIYKNRQSLTNHPIIAACSVVALIISVITVIFLFFSNYSIGDITFNYSDASIVALSILTAFLVGRNIWTVIDSKETISKQKENIATLQNRIDEEMRYLKDKSDFNMGMIYSYFTQMLAKDATNQSKGFAKYIMVEYMINSIKLLTKVRGWDGVTHSIDSIIQTVIDVYEKTYYSPITTEDAKILLERFGEIEDKDKIEKLKELKNLIAKYM